MPAAAISLDRMRTRGLLWPARTGGLNLSPDPRADREDTSGQEPEQASVRDPHHRRHLADVTAAQEHAMPRRGSLERQLRAGISRADDQHIA